MREVKYRVWDKVMKKIFQPQAISFDRQTSAPFAISIPGRSWEQIGKFELLQWTGFTDKNGEDVYDSDLIQISSTIYKVIWNKDLGTFELEEFESASKRKITDLTFGSIIGNIFQNSKRIAQ